MVQLGLFLFQLENIFGGLLEDGGFAQFLSVGVGNEAFQRLEARVDALHASSFVGVGDLAPNPLLALHLRPRRRRAHAVLQTTKTADHFRVLHRKVVIYLFRRRRRRRRIVVRRGGYI